MILTKRACNRNKKTHKKMDKKTEHQQIDTLFREDTNPTPTPRLIPHQT